MTIQKTKLPQKKIDAIRALVKSFFKNKRGDPYIMTDGQCAIFHGVVDRRIKWVWIGAPTRYGKSDALSMALIYLAAFENLKVPIVAGSRDKAEKIMEYVTQHLPDNPELHKGLINTDVSSIDKIEKLKVTMSKSALRWYGGGWIYITSVDSRSIAKEGEGVVGEGGDVVVLEEAGLIKSKDQFSKIVRMPEGDDWGKLVMSGNAIENSVFELAFNDPSFYKVHIGLQQAIDEGRVNEKRLEKQKTLTTMKDWNRYYEVIFPLDDDEAIIKSTYIKFVDHLPSKILYTVCTIDPAISEKQTADFTAKIAVSVGLGNKIYIHGFSNKRLSFKKNLEDMKHWYNTYQPHIFGIESKAFQAAFADSIDDIPIERLEPDGDKIRRLTVQSRWFEHGFVHFVKGTPNIDILIQQLLKFPNADHDDGVDVVSYALEIITKSLTSIKMNSDEQKGQTLTGNIMDTDF